MLECRRGYFTSLTESKTIIHCCYCYKVVYTCMHVCMYVCMYVCISHPRITRRQWLWLHHRNSCCGTRGQWEQKLQKKSLHHHQRNTPTEAIVYLMASWETHSTTLECSHWVFCYPSAPIYYMDMMVIITPYMDIKAMTIANNGLIHLIWVRIAPYMG